MAGSKTLTGGTVGSGIAGVFATVVVWLLGVTVWGASADADSYQKAVTAVPLPVSAVVLVLVTGVGTYVARYATETLPELAKAFDEADWADFGNDEPAEDEAESEEDEDEDLDDEGDPDEDADEDADNEGFDDDEDEDEAESGKKDKDDGKGDK